MHILPHFKVATSHLGHCAHGRLAQKICQAILISLLLVGKQPQTTLKIVGEHLLSGTAVEADEVGENLSGEQRLAGALLLVDDLQQHAAGDVIATGNIDHYEFFTFDNQLPQVGHGNVVAELSVVESPVGVLLDRTRAHRRFPALLCNAIIPPAGGPPWQQRISTCADRH